MKDRVKDAIILLSSFGAGVGGGLIATIIGMSPDGQFVVGGALFLFTGWMIKKELDGALDLKCPKCRFANANEANFCRNCGSALRSQTISIPVEAKN